MPSPRQKDSAEPANGNGTLSLVELLAQASADDLEAELLRREEIHRRDASHLLPTDYLASVRIRELLSYRRRRELEISSLYSTARSLAKLGEIDEVLKTIVHHAHELMATDFTYLSVFNDDGSLRLRASEGTISSAFLAGRIPAGIGVADHVLRTHKPYWVRDYRSADDIKHDPDFDRVTRAEGMVAVLGIPLMAADRVFGVLYAADREPRAFMQDEIALLSAYADHAAVALENARLYDQARRAVGEVEAAHAVIEANVHTLEHSAAIQEALTGAVLAGGGVQDVADLLIAALGDQIVVLDSNHQVLAARFRNGHNAADMDPPSSPDPQWLQTLQPAIEQSRQSKESVLVSGTPAGTCNVIAAVMAGESFLGALILTRPSPLEPHDSHIVERAAQILGLATLQEDSLVDAEERVGRELLSEVLTARRPFPKELAMRARARRANLDKLNTVIVAEVPGERSSTATRQLQQLARERGGLAGSHLGEPTLLVQADDPSVQARRVHHQLKRAVGLPLVVCAAPIGAPPDSPGRQFGLAQRCCQLMRALGLTDTFSTTDTLGLYAVVFDPDRSNDLKILLETTQAIVDYDRRRGTDLLNTLDVYFANQGNLAKTARAMDVHVNTLLKRVERINEILGTDWQQTELALRLQFAVRLRQLARALGSDPT